ncbi:MAG: hypothetical protein LUG46_06750 [Erysipelotrichaceae bacterium]|nr:hypothetical protein [Erysipelotrichaceae bacterium]
MTNVQAGFYIMIIGMIFIVAAIVITIYDKLRYHKYDEIVKGTIIGHKIKHQKEIMYPIAIVEYNVNGQICQVKQNYSMIMYNTVKHSKYNWVIDDKYRLHHYISRKSENIVDLTKDIFPVGSKMNVHYCLNKPQKAYCGALTSMFLFQIILFLAGLFIVAFGMLLMTVLK